MPGSLTRRQLLIRTGGATVALTCFGALPGGAAAEPAGLSSARAASYGAILDAINESPAYHLADRPLRVTRFAEIYAGEGDGFRGYANAVLDAFSRERQLSAGALDVAGLPYIDPECDSHPIVFTV